MSDEKNVRLVIFDTETSTANAKTGFTQLLEITALLVNPENFVVEDVIDEKCRLKETNILSPGASFVNRLTEENLKQKMSCYELSQLLDVKFNQWKDKYNIYWIAYNNTFDKNVFRYNAYMNLRLDNLYLMNTPSSTGNFSYEIDALSFAHALASFGKNSLNIPISPKTGRPSFQLGLLCSENGIKADGDLHTAIVDTKILMEFIKKYSEEETEIWQQMKNTAHKNVASELLQTSDSYFYSTFFMRGKPYYYCYSSIGINNDGSAIFIDLLNFNEEDLEMSAEEILKRKGDSKNRIFRKVFLNKNPILIHPKAANLNEDLKNKIGDIKKLENLHSAIQSNTTFKNRIMAAFFVEDDSFSQKSEFYEDMIYAGFFTGADKNLAKEFHELTDFKSKYKKSKAFTDMRMAYIAKEIIYNNEKIALPESEQRKIENELANRLLNSDLDFKKNKPNFTTIDAAKDDLEKILISYDIDIEDIQNNKIEHPDLTEDDVKVLFASWKYLQDKEEELAGYL